MTIMCIISSNVGHLIKKRGALYGYYKWKNFDNGRENL